MKTNQFISELEKISSNFLEFDSEKRIWNGFTEYTQYRKHLNSLYTEFFNEIDDHIANLMVNKGEPEIKMFITRIVNKFDTINTDIINNDKLCKHQIEVTTKMRDNYIAAGADKNDMKNMTGRIFGWKLELKYLTFRIDPCDFFRIMDRTKWIEEAHPWAEKNYMWSLNMERVGREYVRMSFGQLQNLLAHYCPNSFDNSVTFTQTVKVRQSKEVGFNDTPAQKEFRNYLCHSEKDAIMTKLSELLNEARGKEVAMIIKALTNLKILVWGGRRSELYRLMRTEFNFSVTDSGINDFLNSNKKQAITNKDIENYIHLFENI